MKTINKTINKTSNLMYFRIVMVFFAVILLIISVLDAAFIKSAYGDNLIPVSICFAVAATFSVVATSNLEGTKKVVINPKIAKILIPVLLTSLIAGMVTFFFVS